jgi:hypothetical protein
VGLTRTKPSFFFFFFLLGWGGCRGSWVWGVQPVRSRVGALVIYIIYLRPVDRC